VPEGGKLAVIFANLTKDNLLERKRGFEEAMRELAESAPADAPKYEVVAQLVNEGSEERSREVMKQTLAEHPDLKCFVGMNAQHGPLMLETLKAENQLGKVALVAFDEDAATVDGIEAGSIIGSVVQDPYEYGLQSVRLLAEYARGDDTLRPVKGWSSTLGVTPTAVKKESLAEFRQYLAKHLPAAN
jgi:ribose transport system substrate-binding protein